MPDTPDTSPAIPTALVRPRAQSLLALLPWLIPLAVLILTVVLVIQAAAAQRHRLALDFLDGHGIRPNDPIVFRGVQVGQVHDVALSDDGDKVRIDLQLNPDADFLRTQGCFWIVHPEVSLSRISGLETLFGPRYIAAAAIPPGSSSPVARETPPPLTWMANVEAGPNALIINIRAPRASSIAAGSPVTYREVPVGSVIGVALEADARTVLITAAIRAEHTRLVRDNSVFWNISGIGIDLGLVGGLKLKAESLQTVLAGGLAFATPDTPGEPAGPGRIFALSEFDDRFLKWSPALPPPAPVEPEPGQPRPAPPPARD